MAEVNGFRLRLTPHTKDGGVAKLRMEENNPESMKSLKGESRLRCINPTFDLDMDHVYRGDLFYKCKTTRQLVPCTYEEAEYFVCYNHAQHLRRYSISRFTISEQ